MLSLPKRQSVYAVTKACCSLSSSSKELVSVSPKLRNRNPMNLEKMRIGYKPTGFLADKKNREYWNALELSISGTHTTATVTHWTGRNVCSASTKEWAIQKFLYNYTDLAALKIVGQVIGQRCLETGITEVELLLEKEALEKDKMKTFIRSIKETGLSLQEPSQFQPNNPFYKVHTMRYHTRIKPWEIADE